MASFAPPLLAAERRLSFTSPQPPKDALINAKPDVVDQENIAPVHHNISHSKKRFHLNTPKCPSLSTTKTECKSTPAEGKITKFESSPLTASSGHGHGGPFKITKSKKHTTHTPSLLHPTTAHDSQHNKGIPASESTKKSASKKHGTHTQKSQHHLHKRASNQSIESKASDESKSADSSSTRHKAKLHRRTHTPTIPKTPKVLKRPTRSYRTSEPAVEMPKTFVPNPTPIFLNTDKHPEVKTTLKTMQHLESRLHPERFEKHEKKRIGTHKKLAPTIPKPFDLGSVIKHDEHVDRIHHRHALDDEEDRRRREFEPVHLEEAILHGPTFVPSRTPVSLTEAVALLPFAQERSERTLAFEARQKERMERKEEHRLIAKKMREEREVLKFREQLRENGFKARPVPLSHYHPKLFGNEGIGENHVDIIEPDEEIEEEAKDETTDHEDLENHEEHQNEEEEKDVNEEEEKDVNEEEGVVEEVAPTPQVGKRRVGILEGIRNSLSPLLGRGSS